MFQPTRLGRYLLLKKIATGGMAEIFLAKLEGAAGFEKYVIIKKILPQWSQDPQFISMLIDEAKISVQLNHPSIVQIYELGREEDTYYIVMEYVQGVDVRKLLAKCQALKKKIPQEIALFIICEILEALGYAHVKKDSQGHPLEIIHRDISPQNILLSMEGAVKLTDFGIAKAASRHQETMTGVLKGKFAYMSPEQAGQLPMDHRSDLYALAIVLYELLTQERLFYRGSDIETLDRVRRGQISFSENAEKNIPEKLKEILLKALSLKMEDRYLDTHLFRDDLISFVRKSGKDLRRDRTADFVRELFADELQAELLDVVNETRLVNAETASVAQKDFKGLEVTSEKVLENTRENIGGNQEILVTRILTQESDLISHEINDSLDKSRFKAFIVVILSMTLLGYFLLKEDIDKGAVILPKPSPVVITKKTLKPPEVQGDASLKNVLPISSPSSPSSSAGPTKTDSKSEVSKLENLKKEKVVELKKENTKNGKVGFVSVQALPWGFVKIDGQAIQETPVIKKSLTVGVHTLEVVYEPDDSHLKTSIDVKENEEMMCVATFKSSTNVGERKIRCH